MRSFVRIPLLALSMASLAGCVPNEETHQAKPAIVTSTKEEPTEIVFRGRFYTDKFCTTGPKGELALGDHQVCEVLEVLRGDLKVQRLIDIALPKGADGTSLHRSLESYA